MNVQSPISPLAGPDQSLEVAHTRSQQPTRAVLFADLPGQSLSAALKSTVGIAISRQLPDIGHARLLTPQPQGQAQVLADQTGQRQLTLRQFDNGVAQLELSRPPLTSLVLSGGGAKGAAYPGAIKALEDKGALAGIRTLSGSSAGGITAALLASGMGASAFKALSDGMDLISLLDSANKSHKLFQQICTEIGALTRPLPVVGGFTQLLLNVLPRIQSEAAPLEKVLREESSKSVLNQIAANPAVGREPAVAAIAQKLEKGGPVTFGDLDVLSQRIPQIKSLNITGTAMFEGRPQMVVFNASLTPDMSIARAAHISGSFPGVFQQVGEQAQPFQAQGERTFFQDGGVMLNVPVPEMFDRPFSNSPLRQSDNLILKFEEAQTAVSDRGTKIQAAVDWVVGAPVAARGALQQEALEAFTDQTVVVPLKTEKGDFSTTLGGTLNFSMPDDIKNHLQERLQQAVDAHLESRAQAREQYNFASVEEALMALDDEMLESVAVQHPGGTDAVIEFRLAAREGLSQLMAAIVSGNEAAGRLQLTGEMRDALARLDALACTPIRQEWLVRELNRADNANHQQLLGAMRGQAVESPVLKDAVTEMQKRDITVIAENIRKEVIVPSLYRPGQPDSNVALLRRAEHNLARATTSVQVNQVLDDIIDNYAARNKPWGKPLHSTTIEMAQAWRVAE
ncbi:patatin-like phospholipase family protein [Pseudomonas sp. SWRI79]|uniref:Patatin-like phospholipase family protein n=1 Tax=Pseudomonas farris TaxID=2841207 RepID=A0ABS6PZF1_9PSED|nr:patatin-like phospholipase family protein [Pseudomonas farris]MBV4465843.1 patatin-like phospholipase family protein [Pseudomonas farris]